MNAIEFDTNIMHLFIFEATQIDMETINKAHQHVEVTQRNQRSQPFEAAKRVRRFELFAPKRYEKSGLKY